MIYCSSGSDFGKISVRSGLGSGSRKYLHNDFQQQIICTKSCLFNARSSTVFKKVGLSFLSFVFRLMLEMDSNPDPEPESILVPVPLRQKVEVPAVPVPVSQH